MIRSDLSPVSSCCDAGWAGGSIYFQLRPFVRAASSQHKKLTKCKKGNILSLFFSNYNHPSFKFNVPLSPNQKVQNNLNLLWKMFFSLEKTKQNSAKPSWCCNRHRPPCASEQSRGTKTFSLLLQVLWPLTSDLLFRDYLELRVIRPLHALLSTSSLLLSPPSWRDWMLWMRSWTAALPTPITR